MVYFIDVDEKYCLYINGCDLKNNLYSRKNKTSHIHLGLLPCFLFSLIYFHKLPFHLLRFFISTVGIVITEHIKNCHDIAVTILLLLFCQTLTLTRHFQVFLMICIVGVPLYVISSKQHTFLQMQYLYSAYCFSVKEETNFINEVSVVKKKFAVKGLFD